MSIKSQGAKIFYIILHGNNNKKNYATKRIMSQHFGSQKREMYVCIVYTWICGNLWKFVCVCACTDAVTQSLAWCGKRIGAVLCSCVSKVEACSWIEAAVEVPPSWSERTQGGKEERESRGRSEWWVSREGNRERKLYPVTAREYREECNRYGDSEGVMGKEYGAIDIGIVGQPDVMTCHQPKSGLATVWEIIRAASLLHAAMVRQHMYTYI